LGKHKKEVEEHQAEEQEEVIEEKSVVFVKASFWSRLAYSGYAFDWLSVLEERGVVDGLDWLLGKIKDAQVILDNVRVEAHEIEPMNPEGAPHEVGIGSMKCTSTT